MAVLIDRLKAIILLDPNDVTDDLSRYRDARERANELNEKLQQAEDLIDEIVYDLYGLTDEKIEIVGYQATGFTMVIYQKTACLQYIRYSEILRKPNARDSERCRQ